MATASRISGPPSFWPQLRLSAHRPKATITMITALRAKVWSALISGMSRHM
jgi:hypothetical protein